MEGGSGKETENSNCRTVWIEVELKRDDPLGNVVKIWERAHKKKSPRILLVQAFSEHYWQTKKRQRVRAIFVGEQIMRGSNGQNLYKWEQMKYRPKMIRGSRAKQGAGRMKRAAELLAAKVARLGHSSES